MQQARLILEDGTVFTGRSFGAEKDTGGEIVFNTSMTGYQEILTDPSYKGQIVTMTYPLIGNYGTNDDDFESNNSHVNGFIVKELCSTPSNWRSRESLEEYLKTNDIVGLEGIDTRALTIKLRSKGTMKGIITTGDKSRELLLDKIKQTLESGDRNLVKEVTTDKVYRGGPAGDLRLVLIDCGAKDNILKSLVNRNCEVIVVPADMGAEEILKFNPDGIMISNGPGDPRDAGYVVDTVEVLMKHKPLFGICLGHQILGLACGADTFKLKFGHRGGNHPVKDLKTGRVYITSQNHGYAVSEKSLAGTDLEVTHLNVNDHTVEGLRHKTLPVFSVQYHPEASPGPDDSHYLFDEFINLIKADRVVIDA